MLEILGNTMKLGPENRKLPPFQQQLAVEFTIKPKWAPQKQENLAKIDEILLLETFWIRQKLKRPCLAHLVRAQFLPILWSGVRSYFAVDFFPNGAE
ncbi:hypothetical protein ACH5RR_028678 [Cinchona calisaya]|uniref:Uncharacterized protein n=1 Tax=Cinchona calisaya TaxID=153742 RepID=A0ABD2YPH4_9GENT